MPPKADDIFATVRTTRGGATCFSTTSGELLHHLDETVLVVRILSYQINKVLKASLATSLGTLPNNTIP